MNKENNIPTNIKSILLIDFENIQKFNIDDLDITTTLIYIFTGINQKKIPITLVKKTQKFGQAVEWIEIKGQGKNTLDFHIAFF